MMFCGTILIRNLGLSLDKIVADVLGVDGPHMTGLGLDDDDPVLPGMSAATENQSQALNFSNLDMSFTSTAGKLQA